MSNNTNPNPASTACDIEQSANFSLDLTPANHKALFQSIAAAKGDLYMMSIDDLRVIDGFNPRIRDAGLDAHIRAIADSIKMNGFYRDKPIAGYGALDGKKPVIYVTDGHNRLEALRLAIAEGAQIDEVPVIVKDRSTTIEDLTVALVRSNEGKRLTPLEIAIVCKRLVNFGWTIPRIAESLGFTPEYVGQLLTLAGAPREIRQMVQAGEATAATALDAIRKHGSDAGGVMAQALEQAKSQGKTKVTAKFLPEQVRRKAIVKQAPQMIEALQQLRADPVYSNLPDKLKLLIDEIVQKIPQGPIQS